MSSQCFFFKQQGYVEQICTCENMEVGSMKIIVITVLCEDDDG